MNSFLSTSRQYSIAMDFLQSADIVDDMRRILFEITIAPRKETKAYADIAAVGFYNSREDGRGWYLDWSSNAGQ
jgi:hypothetical protein